jgi:hypothetical protein
MAHNTKRARSSGANRSPKRASKSLTDSSIVPRSRRSSKPSLFVSRSTRSSNPSVTLARTHVDFSSSKSFAVLARMRRTGESIDVASRDKHTYPAHVLRHLQNAARREHQPNPFRKVKGEWIASPSDKLSRQRSLLTEDGYVSIIVKGSKKSSELSRYNTIVEHLVNPEKLAKRSGLSKEEVFGQALDDFKEFSDKRIAGKPYLTDPDLVFRLADFGIIKTEELGSDQVARGGRR